MPLYGVPMSEFTSETSGAAQEEVSGIQASPEHNAANDVASPSGASDSTPSDSTPSDSTPTDSTPPDSTPSDSSGSAAGETLGASTPGDDALEKDPSDWVSGDDPITPSQKSYLDTLARQNGEELSADLTKAEASQHIERLKSQLGQE